LPDISEAGVRSLEQAIEIFPNQPGTWNTLAGIYASLGKHDRAVAAFRQALALVPDTDAIAISLGDHLLALGEISEAEKAYRRVIAQHNHYEPALRMVGACL